MELPYCIVGHSERRQYHGETDETVNSRILKLKEEKIVPIICIGETLEQREAGQTEEVVIAQITGCLSGLDSSEDLVIAYEPVWAIGTGKNATPEQAQQVHLLIRNWLAGKYGKATADQIVILYGGSMKPENIDALLSMPDIDGGLIGGASLKIDQFTNMINSAVKAIEKRS
jgi:triosephosphate isomerase